MSVFDRWLDDEDLSAAPPKKPFWTIDIEDEDEVKEWVSTAYDDLRQRGRPRVRMMRKNLAAYRGIQYRQGETRDGESASRRRAKNPRIIVNHLMEMVEQSVSRTTKFRPDIASEPASEDFEDQQIAKINDDLTDALWYRADIDSIYHRHNRQARIFGESYLVVRWNPDIGPYDKDWLQEQFREAGIDKRVSDLSTAELKKIIRKEIKEFKRLPLIGEDGKQVHAVDGTPLYIDKPMRIGDIEYKLWLPFHVWLQRTTSGDYADVEWAVLEERMNVEDAKAKWPEKADQIRANDSERYFDAENLVEAQTNNDVTILHFYHRSIPQLDQGRMITMTRDAVLENKSNPYEWNDQRVFPWDRMTDLDTPAVLNGEAVVRHGRPLQALFNNSISMVARNQFLMAHPKWFYQANSINPDSLSNQATMVAVKGQQYPVMQQASPTGGETFRWMDIVKENFQQIMGVFGVSRGEPPPGVRAGVAIQFLDEQENERANVSIAKHNASVRHTAILTSMNMGIFYDKEDGRLEDLLGKTKASELEFFEFADLTGINDVRVHTASALPRQKAARIQTLLDLSERFPEELDSRQVLDMLDLGQKDKFISLATIAVRSSEKEGDSLIRTGKMESPEKWEDHLMHYKIHMSMMNDPSFKKNATKKMQETMEKHIMAHEMFMSENAKKNPAYLQLLMMKYPNFPVFFEDPELLLKLQPQPAMPVAPEEGGQPPGPAAGPMQLPPEAVPPGAENEIPVAENIPGGY